MRFFEAYRTLPRSGGMDDQPAARLAGMEMAWEVRALIAKLSGEDGGKNMTERETWLVTIIYPRRDGE